MSEQEKNNSLAKMDNSISFVEGALVAMDFSGQWKLCKMWLSSGMLPAQYKSPEQVMIGLQYAAELGLKGLMALRQIAVIKGTPSIYGDLPLAIVRHSRELEYFKEYFVDENSMEICVKNKNLKNPVFGAVCFVQRKGDKETNETFFTVQEARDAGLFQNDTYKKWLKTMLKRRARSANLKDIFPDLLEGMAIAEYDHNVLPDSPEGARQITPGDKIAAIDMATSQDAAEMKNDFMDGNGDQQGETSGQDAESHGSPQNQELRGEAGGQPQPQPPPTENGKGDKNKPERDTLSYDYANVMCELGGFDTTINNEPAPEFQRLYNEAQKAHLVSLRSKVKKLGERAAEQRRAQGAGSPQPGADDPAYNPMTGETSESEQGPGSFDLSGSIDDNVEF